MPEDSAVVSNPPHIPITVLDHQILATAASREIRQQKTVVGRGRNRQRRLLFAGRGIQNQHRRFSFVPIRPLANAALVRRLDVFGLAHEEHVIPAVAIPIVDLNRQVAVDAPVFGGGNAVLPQHITKDGRRRQARDLARSIDALHEEQIRVRRPHSDRRCAGSPRKVLAVNLADPMNDRPWTGCCVLAVRFATHPNRQGQTRRNLANTNNSLFAPRTIRFSQPPAMILSCRENPTSKTYPAARDWKSPPRPCVGGSVPESYLPTALSSPSSRLRRLRRRRDGKKGLSGASRVAVSRAPTDARSVEGSRTAVFLECSSCNRFLGSR